MGMLISKNKGKIALVAGIVVVGAMLMAAAATCTCGTCLGCLLR